MIKTSSTVIRTHDQARTLRELIKRQETKHPAAERPTSSRTMAILSGKGGVGKSVLALNLAVGLAQDGCKVCLLDANLGVGSLELMCGLSGYWNLSHVITGARQLTEITLHAPEGFDLIPGASGITELTDCPASAQAALLDQLQELERTYELLIIDTGSGLHRLARLFAWAADQLLVVTTPEPTSITDAYATIKSLGGADRPPVGLVVNQAESVQLAEKIGDRLKQTTRMFLHADVDTWGSIPWDAAVPQSVSARQPLLTFQPTSPAARAVTRLVNHCQAGFRASRGEHPYFTRLFHTLQRAA